MRIDTFALIVLVLLIILPASASEPGQPLDCSDWVLLEPGLSCSMFEVFGLPDSSVFLRSGGNLAVDNQGGIIALRETLVQFDGSGYDHAMYRFDLVRRTSDGESVLAHIEDRQFVNNGEDHIRPTVGLCASNTECRAFDDEHTERVVVFDPLAGRLLIPMRSYCKWISQGNPTDCNPTSYGGGWWIVAINGFAPLLEIFQGYAPASGPLSFVVPSLPEGFQYADYFDTYYGDLATVGNWSQAQPLQCGYPATAPTVGDYLTVQDTLPLPPPGRGYYYVTAVNSQGQRRYGRQSNGGVLTGRDPAVLPVCD